MMYEARQYCTFMSSTCCFSSLAATSLAGCAFKVPTLPSILLWMRVMCALHLAIFLEICGVVAFLHSLLMSVIVVSDKFADFHFGLLLLCGDSLRLRYLRCFATSSSAPTWTSSIFVCFMYFQSVTYKFQSGCAMLRSQIPI